MLSETILLSESPNYKQMALIGPEGAIVSFVPKRDDVKGDHVVLSPQDLDRLCQAWAGCSPLSKASIAWQRQAKEWQVVSAALVEVLRRNGVGGRAYHAAIELYEQQKADSKPHNHPLSLGCGPSCKACPACGEHLEGHAEPWVQLCAAWIRAYRGPTVAFPECTCWQKAD